MHAGRTTTFIFLILSLLTLAAGYAVVRHSQLEHKLLPAQDSTFPWRSFISTDSYHGGKSTIDLRDSTYNLSFDFTLAAGIQYPYVSLGLTFDDDTHPERLVDWSAYSSIWFRVKCRPANVLTFVLHTKDAIATDFSDITTFRPATSYISCNENWQDVEINLHRLDTPEWWLSEHKVNLASREYHLEQVRAFSITSSPQSPLGQTSSVTLEEIGLRARNWQLIYGAAVFGVLVWGGFIFWCFPQFARQKPAPVTQIVTPVPYQQVNTESRQGREKSAVLDYLASQYVNPDLSVDGVVNALGINRTKINDILRDETGLTFSAYLNKVRLTEAIRLLTEKKMSVSEAAFAVGYSSLSYFNRVFKKEYGCAPSAYKNLPQTSSHPNDTHLNNPRD